VIAATVVDIRLPLVGSVVVANAVSGNTESSELVNGDRAGLIGAAIMMLAGVLGAQRLPKRTSTAHESDSSHR